MHDAVSGDRAGIPSAGIMTEKFVTAAELMGATLGAAGYRFVTIPHPISSAGLDTLAATARVAAAECAALITGQPTM